MEGGGCGAARIPGQKEHYRHHRHLVNIVPGKHLHAVKPNSPAACRGHEIPVIQAAEGPDYRRQHKAPYPLVVPEVYTFFAAAAAEQEERNDGQRNANPLIQVKPFAKDYHCADKDHYRPCGVDWPNDCKRQVLHCVIP